MDKTTVPAPPATRELRGLALYLEHGPEKIIRILSHTYEVPSCSGEKTYVVRLDRGSCECPDFERRQAPCKHVYAATVAAARAKASRARVAS